MPNYHTQISSFDVMNTALQSTAQNIASINTNNYRPGRAMLESGSDEYGVRTAKAYPQWNPGPAVVTNFSELASRSAQEQNAILYHNNERDYAVLRGNEMAEQQRLQGFTTLAEQEVRGYQEAATLQAKGYMDQMSPDLPREFVNLINTEMAYSANAAVIRTQADMVGALIDTIA